MMMRVAPTQVLAGTRGGISSSKDLYEYPTFPSCQCWDCSKLWEIDNQCQKQYFKNRNMQWICYFVFFSLIMIMEFCCMVPGGSGKTVKNEQNWPFLAIFIIFIKIMINLIKRQLKTDHLLFMYYYYS